MMNSNQYLRPDELPITDMKKSPLVLLAQTCSNIGADILGNGKLRLGGNGGGDNGKRKPSSLIGVDGGSLKSNSRSDSANSEKTQANSIDMNRSSVNSLSAGDESQTTSNHHHHHQRQSPPTNGTTNGRMPMAEHNQRLGSGGGGGSPTGLTGNTEQITNGQSPTAPKSKIFKPYETSKSIKCDSGSAGSTPTMTTNGHNGGSDQHQRSGSNNSNHSDVNNRDNRKSGSGGAGSPHRNMQPQGQNRPGSNQARSSSAYSNHSTSDNGQHHSGHSQKPKSSPTAAESAAAASNQQHLLELEVAKAAYAANQGFPGYQNSIAEHELLMKSFAYHQQLAAASNAAAAAAAMAGRKVCSDPFCRGCQMAMAGLPSMVPCTSAMAGLPNGGHPSARMNPFAGSASAAASLLSSASRYPHPGAGGPAGPAGAGPGGRPFTCSWTAGASYCGKTFGTSEELLQHLKSHTNGYNPSGFPTPPLGYPHLDPLHLTSPVQRVGLRRTAFDPVSRYHPYGGKFGPSAAAAAGLYPLLNHSSLASMNPQTVASLGLGGHGYPPMSGAGGPYGSPYADRIGPPIPP